VTKPQTSFINPAIANLIEAKQEIQALMEETRKVEDGLTEKDEEYVSALEMMTFRIDAIQLEQEKMRKQMLIFMTCAIVFAGGLFYWVFHR
jgi:hypothetical protein